MKYLVINQYPADRGSGIANCSRNLVSYLRSVGVEVHCISNDNRIEIEQFREQVASRVRSEYDPREWIIETPEANAPTALLPAGYTVHVRLHTPRAIAQEFDQSPITPGLLDLELGVVRQAAVVSSPSHALARLLRSRIGDGPIHVYKNPLPDRTEYPDIGARDYDVVFMGYFSRLKGVGVLNQILAAVPEHYSACVIGRRASAHRFDPQIRCRLDVHEHIDGPDRYSYLRSAKVFLMPSRFENCSMAVLESIVAGTVTVGWNVGGNAEIAGPPVINLVEYGDVDAMVHAVRSVVDTPYPPEQAFSKAACRLSKDFRDGWQHVSNLLKTGSAKQSYVGMDASQHHRGTASSPATREETRVSPD